MFDYLEKLRAKPDKVKSRIAFLSAFCFAGVIFVFWIGVIYPDWKGNQDKQNNVSKLEPSPIGAFGNTIFANFSVIGEKLKEIKSTITAFSSIPEYYTSTSSDKVSSTTRE